LSPPFVEDQKVVWAKGFGYADYEKRIPATPDTVYHIASETKPFAATLVMQLVEQGKLDLDEPISHTRVTSRTIRSGSSISSVTPRRPETGGPLRVRRSTL
jgi:hypothetical protein